MNHLSYNNPLLADFPSPNLEIDEEALEYLQAQQRTEQLQALISSAYENPMAAELLANALIRENTEQMNGLISLTMCHPPEVLIDLFNLAQVNPIVNEALVQAIMIKDINGSTGLHIIAANAVEQLSAFIEAARNNLAIYRALAKALNAIDNNTKNVLEIIANSPDALAYLSALIDLDSHYNDILISNALINMLPNRAFFHQYRKDFVSFHIFDYLNEIIKPVFSAKLTRFILSELVVPRASSNVIQYYLNTAFSQEYQNTSTELTITDASIKEGVVLVMLRMIQPMKSFSEAHDTLTLPHHTGSSAVDIFRNIFIQRSDEILNLLLTKIDAIPLEEVSLLAESLTEALTDDNSPYRGLCLQNYNFENDQASYGKTYLWQQLMDRLQQRLTKEESSSNDKQTTNSSSALINNNSAFFKPADSKQGQEDSETQPAPSNNRNTMN